MDDRYFYSLTRWQRLKCFVRRYWRWVATLGDPAQCANCGTLYHLWSNNPCPNCRHRAVEY